MDREPRVFSIPAGAPFLPTLADGILDGTLLPGSRYRDDPASLADLTVFLPTRRAARSLAGELVRRLGAGAAVLPRIRPLGDVDEDGADGLADPSELDLPPPIDGPDRLVALAGLVLAWRGAIGTGRLVTPSGHEITVPASAADAVHLARDLLSLIDQAEIEGVDWTRLRDIVPDDYAGWWQLTLGFLGIALDAWPAHLAEIARMDPTAHRIAVLRAVAGRLRQGLVSGPVIAAGSTGSQPATAALLSAVARLPQGAVVLPGLDGTLDDAALAALASGEVEGAASHPQAALARLIATMGIGRDEVRQLGAVAPDLAARARIVSAALLPAPDTDRWPAIAAGLAADPAGTGAALSGIALAVAANEAEEALAIAAALREAVEDGDATAALVTPDRTLARRVVAELARFGIEAEDSAGIPLARTRPGALALLLADCVAAGLDPVGVAALTRHPLAAFGMPRGEARAAARALEIACLRGPRLKPGGAALVEAAARLAVAGRRGHGVHPAVGHLDTATLAAARTLTARIRDAVAPLEAFAGTGAVDHRRLVGAFAAALRDVARDEGGSDARLFEGAAGTALARFLVAHLDGGAAPLAVDLAGFPALLRALMQGETVRRPHRPARVSIWGQLEARLMTVDRLVVGGLNEGVWPPATDTGPWLSRPMRARLGFPPPEQRIGLGAHDFAEALGGRDVLLTRAEKSGGAPAVPTRFLTRLLALAGPGETAAMVARGARHLDRARRVDDRAAERRCERPAPAPPMAARPDRLSVTEIETWIRDPYAIYARRILELEPLADLGERPDFGDRGSVLHAALARFSREWDGPFDDAAVAALRAIGHEEFRAIEAFPEIHALWWPRFVSAAGWLVRTFEAARPDVRRFPEVSGSWPIDGPAGTFTLTGRADRIDLLDDGRLSIVDFKSGSAPSDKQIAFGETPQLALEAAIARRGGFRDVPAGEAAELVHVVLKGIEGRDAVLAYAGYKGGRGGPPRSLAETVVETERSLVGLVAAYARADKGYLSRAHPFKRGEEGLYDHLARVREWSVGEDDGDDEA